MIDFRYNINNARIKAKIDQPLVLSVIAQIHHIKVCHFGHIQLNVQVSWHMKCMRLIIVAIAVFTVPLFFFRFVNTFRYSCVNRFMDKSVCVYFSSLQMFQQGKIEILISCAFITYRQVFSIHYPWDEEIESNPLSIKSIWQASNVDSISVLH